MEQEESLSAIGSDPVLWHPLREFGQNKCREPGGSGRTTMVGPGWWGGGAEVHREPVAL